MPAPFVTQLCGYRDGRPNTSDQNDQMSVELGHALFQQLGVASDAPAPNEVGALMETLIAEDLRSRRPDLRIERSQSARKFAQYEHLAAIAKARAAVTAADPKNPLEAIDQLVSDLTIEQTREIILRRLEKVRRDVAAGFDLMSELVNDLPSESMLKMDIVVAGDFPNAELEIALSSKWTLRTDRAQDCISQGTKLVSLRRGRMPHFAAITMEPRPAMLRLLADGSGSIDCVYHLDLPALARAIDELAAKRPKTRRDSWSPAATFDRLVRQRRLRDYEDLVREVRRTRPSVPDVDGGQ